MRTRCQSVDGHADWYDAKRSPDEYSFNEVYHDVWRVLFTPSHPVASLIQEEFDRTGLVPGEYAAAHMRALYGRNENRKDDVAYDWSRNAVNCATKLRPGGPILFASDHTYSTKVALEYGEEMNTTIVARVHDKLPLHLDKIDNLDSLQSSDFYDVFVDLYLMGMGRCLTYNRGGFGHWALLIGYNSTCSQHQKTSAKGIGVRCNWTEPESPRRAPQRSGALLFREPMHNEGVAAGDSVENRQSSGSSIESLPKWMHDYFKWHAHEVQNLDESNWRSKKFLVMFCTGERACGGISDRLKPLPFVLLLAHRSQRVLMILWQKPAPLEEYLLPPEGGLDWRCPEWLAPLLLSSSGGIGHATPDTARMVELKHDESVLFTKIQAPTAGQDYYDAHPEADSTYESVFHQLFRKFFTPSPRLEALIKTKMREHNLAPAQYASAHLRAMYGNRKYRDPNETIALTVNAINCASQLFPGGPVYYAADIKFSVHVAQEYGRQRNLPVASLEFEENPLHFDKDVHWKTRDPSAYDDTFVDLYMLGQSQCVAYSNGGYGTFGQLLSYNASCTIRHFARRRILNKCKWVNKDGTSKDLAPPEVIIPKELLVEPE